MSALSDFALPQMLIYANYWLQKGKRWALHSRFVGKMRPCGVSTCEYFNMGSSFMSFRKRRRPREARPWASSIPGISIHCQTATRKLCQQKQSSKGLLMPMSFIEMTLHLKVRRLVALTKSHNIDASCQASRCNWRFRFASLWGKSRWPRAGPGHVMASHAMPGLARTVPCYIFFSVMQCHHCFASFCFETAFLEQIAPGICR